MKYVMLFFISLLVMGCKEKKSPKIEVYLLNHRLSFVNTVPFAETAKYKEIQYDRAKDIFKDTSFDTIRDEVVFAGEFKADSIDLQSKPFIDDNEIKAFDLKANRFVFSREVIKRIGDLYPERNFGKQFVITVDKEPKLTGYFWNTDSSINCRWYYIECLSNPIASNNAQEVEVVTLYNGKNNEKVTLAGFTYTRHKELIAAFEETHRLIK